MSNNVNPLARTIFRQQIHMFMAQCFWYLGTTYTLGLEALRVVDTWSSLEIATRYYTAYPYIMQAFANEDTHALKSALSVLTGVNLR